MSKATENNTVNEEKKVVVTLPILNEDDMVQYVAVNGRSFMIRRGEEVEVPECVAEVLKNSERQKLEAMKFRRQLEKQSGDM